MAMATEALDQHLPFFFSRSLSPSNFSTPTSMPAALPSPKRPDRPLPAPPKSPKSHKSAKDLPPRPSIPQFEKPLYAANLPGPSEAGPSRVRPAIAWATMSSRRVFSRMLKQPRVLAHLLDLVTWGDFRALANTCRDFRHGLMQHPECRNTILAQYVPGFRFAVHTGDLRNYREVAVDFHDLTLLVMSQFVPLHKYPMHALSVLSSHAQDADHAALYQSTLKHVALTQAHSRFVLLLQSLVHSAPPFIPYADDPEDSFNLLAPAGARAPQLTGVRELVFPAPLSYFGGNNTTSAESPQPISGGVKISKKRTGGSSVVPMAPRSLSLSPTRASGDFQALLGHPQRGRTKSIFGASRVPPPPPVPEPAAIKYAQTWRKSSYAKPQPPTPRNDQSSASASASENDLQVPKRRFTSTIFSSESSLARPLSTRSNTDDTDSSGSPKDTPVSGPDGVSVPRGTSPHDLYLATSRTRAPVLRTFVPCTRLDDDAIAACEDQLVDAGLWEQLSVGDIVCNFGYVPPVEADKPGTSTESTGTPKQEWLLYDGTCLVLYIPPGPPPLEDPLTLPSPFYYSHILPPFSNPNYILSLPAPPPSVSLNSSSRSYSRSHSCSEHSHSHSPSRSQSHAHARPYDLELDRDREPANPHVQLTLAHVPTRVRSPRSPGGFAVVRRYVWIARLPYVGPNAGLGKRWQGEWMLEGEGTKEGRQSLLDALTDGPDRSGLTRRGRWEVVRDKSESGRVWMKLLVPNVDRGEETENVIDLPPSARSSNVH